MGTDAQGPVPIDRAAGLQMYAAYLAEHPEVSPEDDVEVACFGDSPALADELIAFIVGGTKRATASLVASYRAEDEPLPKIGAHWVCCDGSGQPRAVLRTWELRLGPFRSVDAQFAWDEGEYDRTLESWLAGHRSAHGREAQRLGIEFTEDLEVCFERFWCVWPSDLAD